MPKANKLPSHMIWLPGLTKDMMRKDNCSFVVQLTVGALLYILYLKSTLERIYMRIPVGKWNSDL